MRHPFSTFLPRALFATLLVASVAGPALAQEAGDPRRGGEIYRACVGCHSLRPGVHLTGPSLAGMFGHGAGEAQGFGRYSEALTKAGLTWDKDTLNAWLAGPQALVPGTLMVFRGIADDQARDDLISFLELAAAPGGAEAVVAQGLIAREHADGQMPEPLKHAPPNQQVTALRHCRDGYFVSTADGTETPFWEMNVRLKLDTRSTGPAPGRPVIVGAGMMGDRVSIIFSSVGELASFLTEMC